jgi:adhesin transport system membrane fusion protein
MWSDQSGNEDKTRAARVAHLENFHRGRHGLLLGLLLAGLVIFALWAMFFRIDEVAKATGEVIASSRVQVIQAVDGGVIAELNVKEGDRVKLGQVLARLDQTRIDASVGEVDARLYALKAKATRLRAEVTGSEEPQFKDDLIKRFSETVGVERALFKQRRVGLNEELRTMQVAVQISRKEQDLIDKLFKDGDASGSELLRAQRNMNDAEARLVNRKNKFLEDARLELA